MCVFCNGLLVWVAGDPTPGALVKLVYGDDEEFGHECDEEPPRRLLRRLGIAGYAQPDFQYAGTTTIATIVCGPTLVCMTLEECEAFVYGDTVYCTVDPTTQRVTYTPHSKTTESEPLGIFLTLQAHATAALARIYLFCKPPHDLSIP